MLSYLNISKAAADTFPTLPNINLFQLVLDVTKDIITAKAYELGLNWK
jgi:hypothetical protein